MLDYRYRVYAPAATICIVTKNRRDNLRRAVRSAAMQEGPRIEIIIIDDGSTDGTAEMIRGEFPAIRFERREQSKGYIARRNEAARLASAPFLFSIDDDAEFSANHIIAQTLSEFDHPKIGAVALPFVNVLQSQQVMQHAPDTQATYVTDTYIGTAHALRRDIFNALGGYRAHFVHQGEEADYCVRLLASGYVVRLGAADPVHHYESPHRDVRRMDYYGRRNDVLYACHNVPWAYLPLHLAGTVFNGLKAALRSATYPCRMVCGIMAGLLDGCYYWRCRQPVDARVYRLSRRLKKSGPLSLDQMAL